MIHLSDKGPDIEWNVVALCPNDHRRAHHGDDQDAIRGQLITLLITRFPGAASALENRAGSEEGRTP